MNGFDQHNLSHLSASSLNLWINNPSRWVAEKLCGFKSPQGYAAMRGRVVESAVSDMLHGVDEADAIESAEAAFERQVIMPNARSQKEFEVIRPMIMQAMIALQDFGEPHLDNTRQHAVRRKCRLPDGGAIEFRGYLDFYWPEHNLIVDLKTSLALRKIMPIEHQRQRALYSVKPGVTVKFLYVTPKRWLFLEDGDTAEILSEIRWHVGRLERFLRLGDRDLLTSIVPVNTDSFYWSDCVNQATEIYDRPVIGA